MHSSLMVASRNRLTAERRLLMASLRIRRDFVKAYSKISPSASNVFWADGGIVVFPASVRTEAESGRARPAISNYSWGRLRSLCSGSVDNSRFPLKGARSISGGFSDDHLFRWKTESRINPNGYPETELRIPSQNQRTAFNQFFLPYLFRHP